MTSEDGQLDLQAAIQLLRQQGYSDSLKSFSDVPTKSMANLQTIIDLLCEISLHDGLTGLANSRYFKVALEQEIDRVLRSGGVALLLLIDIDNFKHINDSHGHMAGDQALREVAQVLARNVRPMDTIARNGGDEFAAILPNSRPDVGIMVAERIREQVEQTRITMPDGKKIHVTISIGGSHIFTGYKLVAEEVLKLADQELYRAKSLGRNRVSMDRPVPMPVSVDEKHQLLDIFRTGHK